MAGGGRARLRAEEPPVPHVLRSSYRACQRAGGRGARGSPGHPVSGVPEVWHHWERWQLSAPSRSTFQGPRIARPQDRERLSLQHRPPRWSRKDHMLGDPEVFLELLGAESGPQVDRFPWWSPRASQKGVHVCACSRSLRHPPLAAAGGDREVPLEQPPSEDGDASVVPGRRQATRKCWQSLDPMANPRHTGRCQR